jgi:hypothetical protein
VVEINEDGEISNSLSDTKNEPLKEKQDLSTQNRCSEVKIMSKADIGVQTSVSFSSVDISSQELLFPFTR